MDIDALLKSLSKEMGSECCYNTWRPSPKQSAFIFDESPVQLLYAPNRTGKSASMGRKVAELAWGKRGVRGRRSAHYDVIVSSLTYQLNYSVMVPAIKQFIPEAWWYLNKKDNEIIITNPAGITVRVYLRCQSQGREAVQGISASMCLQDEQLSDESYLNELLMRLVDVQGEQVHGFTPLLGANFATDLEGTRHHFELTDNPILSLAEVEKAAEKMSDVEKRIRLHGEVIDLSGNRFIAQSKLDAIKSTAIKAKLERWNGLWRELYYTDEVYDEGVHYIMTADIASGSGEDYTHIVIYALYYDGTAEHVFSAYSNTADIPSATEYMMALHKTWNKTSFLCDATGLGISVAQTLAREDNMISMRRKDADLRYLTNKVGFQISSTSREWLLSEYLYALTKGKYRIGNDPQLFQELKVFAYDLGRRRYEHPAGGHDDSIFAHALANVAISMSTLPTPPKANSPIHLKDMTFNDLMAWEARAARQKEQEEYE